MSSSDEHEKLSENYIYKRIAECKSRRQLCSSTENSFLSSLRAIDVFISSDLAHPFNTKYYKSCYGSLLLALKLDSTSLMRNRVKGNDKYPFIETSDKQRCFVYRQETYCSICRTLCSTKLPSFIGYVCDVCNKMFPDVVKTFCYSVAYSKANLGQKSLDTKNDYIKNLHKDNKKLYNDAFILLYKSCYDCAESILDNLSLCSSFLNLSFNKCVYDIFISDDAVDYEMSVNDKTQAVCRLIISSRTGRSTVRKSKRDIISMIADGYKNISLCKEYIESAKFADKSEVKERIERTMRSANLLISILLCDQTSSEFSDLVSQTREQKQTDSITKLARYRVCKKLAKVSDICIQKYEIKSNDNYYTIYDRIAEKRK